LWVADVPRVEAQPVDSGIYSCERQAVIEMYIGDERYAYRLLNRGQRVGGLAVGDGYAHELTAASFKLSYLPDRRPGVARVGLGHRLNGYRRTATHGHTADINRSRNTPLHHLIKLS
jgi:hypothetical protein